MIRLNLDAAEHEYSPLGGVVFKYRRGTTAAAIKSRLETRDADGKSDTVDAAVQFIARSVTGLSGLADAEGKELPWPAALDHRVAILNACPSEWILDLYGEINRKAEEADASGKG